MTAQSAPRLDQAAVRQQIATATKELQTRVNPRAVEVANDVLTRALQSGRRSLPVRARAPHEHVRMSDQVLIGRLRERIDDGVDGTSVGAVYLQVNRDAQLEQITIELFVQFRRVILDLAEHVRTIASEVTSELLGPEAGEVHVMLTHIHVSDVTRGDPHLVDPADEPL